MLAPGDRIPDVTLYGTDGHPVSLAGFGPMLLVFYLYDWTGT
jgi:peroxiredoxin